MKNKLIRGDIVNAISNDTGLSKNSIDLVIRALIDNIALSLSQGKSIQLIGLGTFGIKKMAARTGRNPRTNEPVHIPTRIVPYFRVSEKLKNSIKNEL